MRSPFARYSIGVLMLVILACALGFAALHRPSLLWAAVFTSAALALLVASLILVAIRRGPRRAFWIGFAIAGWAYWFVAMAPWIAEELGPRQATTALIDLLYARLNAPEEAPGGAAGGIPGGAAWGNLPREARIMLASGAVSIVHEGPEDRWKAWTEPVEDTDGTLIGNLVFAAPGPFRRICHALFVLISALAGAILATWAARGEDERRTRPLDSRRGRRSIRRPPREGISADRR